MSFMPEREPWPPQKSTFEDFWPKRQREDIIIERCHFERFEIEERKIGVLRVYLGQKERIHIELSDHVLKICRHRDSWSFPGQKKRGIING